MKQTDRGEYDDILSLPHHISKKHAPLPMSSRAAQFLPFAALTGYDEVLREASRETEARIALGEEDQAQIDRALRWLCEHPGHERVWSIVYFHQDSTQAGGSYQRVRARIRRIYPQQGQLQLEDGLMLRFEDLLALDPEG